MINCLGFLLLCCFYITMDSTLHEHVSSLNIVETSAAGGAVDLRNFKPVRVLGEGAYGKAVLVYDCAADFNLVVKLIDIGATPDLVQCLDIMNEKLIMDKLTSRWFAQCYFTAITERHAWFGLKYYAGGSLEDLIQKYSTTETKLSFGDAQFLIVEIFIAVHKLHSKHILHRDIKPDNLLIDDEGHIVLIDFGLSVTLDKKKPLEDQVCDETFESGNKFTAPEMTFDYSAYSYSADLYSVGKTIGHMCKEENQDGTWSDENKSDLMEVQAALTSDNPSERANLRSVAKLGLFRGIKWKDAKARMLDMTKFGPGEVVIHKPTSNFHIDMGSLEIPIVESFLDSQHFGSYDRYWQRIQKQ